MQHLIQDTSFLVTPVLRNCLSVASFEVEQQLLQVLGLPVVAAGVFVNHIIVGGETVDASHHAGVRVAAQVYLLEIGTDVAVQLLRVGYTEDYWGLLEVQLVDEGVQCGER